MYNLGNLSRYAEMNGKCCKVTADSDHTCSPHPMTFDKRLLTRVEGDWSPRCSASDLARCHCRPRDGVISKLRMLSQQSSISVKTGAGETHITVNVDSVTRISLLKNPRNGNLRTQICRSTSSNSNLRRNDVELWECGVWIVNSQALDSNEVLSCWNACRNGDDVSFWWSLATVGTILARMRGGKSYASNPKFHLGKSGQCRGSWTTHLRTRQMLQQ